MPYKDPEKKKAYYRNRYHKAKQDLIDKIDKAVKADPRSPMRLSRKTPNKPKRKVDPDKFINGVLRWMDRKGIE